jgi:uncharacterized protein
VSNPQLLALLLLVGCSNAAPSSKPALELTGRVVDRANLIDAPTEALLTARLAKLERQTGAQLIVVTTPSLNGQTIAGYSINLARSWGIGSKERNDGLLLTLAPTERKVRIEVGTGLEAIMTNDLCATIIKKKMTPHLKAGKMQTAILAGIGGMIRTMDSQRKRLKSV